jgi:hypothetical protein
MSQTNCKSSSFTLREIDILLRVVSHDSISVVFADSITQQPLKQILLRLTYDFTGPMERDEYGASMGTITYNGKSYCFKFAKNDGRYTVTIFEG